MIKQRLLALRYLCGITALNIAFGLVCFAQQTSAPKAAAQITAPPSVTAQIAAEWTRAKEFTKEYLDAMPEDGIGLKPTPDIRSFAEQMLHFTNANFMFASAAAGVPNPYDKKNLEKMPEYTASKAALTKIVLESYDFVISSIGKLDSAKLNEPIKLFGRDVTRRVAFEKAFEHQTHHRGQTTIYLRLKGVKPPNEKLF